MVLLSTHLSHYKVVYPNDPPIACNLLSIAGDKKLFFEHRDKRSLFSKMYKELFINEWFISKKPSVNVKKRDFLFFYKISRRDDLPFILPELLTDNQVIKRQSSIKFLGILLNENLSRKEHLKFTENKIAKNKGLPYKAKPCLNKDSLIQLLHSLLP